jgi:hypothetical protein
MERETDAVLKAGRLLERAARRIRQQKGALGNAHREIIREQLEAVLALIPNRQRLTTCRKSSSWRTFATC